jgi:hypothetical protein
MVGVLNWIVVAAGVVGALAVVIFFVGPRE